MKSVTKQYLYNLFSNLFTKRVEPSAELLEKTDMSEPALIAKVEAFIPDTICKSTLRSSFISLGGSNNLGFLIHECGNHKKTFITKVSSSFFLTREKRFLQWHQTKVNPKNSFAVPYISDGLLNSTNSIECLITEKLDSVRKPTNQQIINLYKKSHFGENFFDESHAENDMFEGGSRIRDVLINLVANQDESSSFIFLDTFFRARIDIIPQFEESLLDCLRGLKKIHEKVYFDLEKKDFGFVHGDFKPSNMLKTQNNELCLIDFQYYCIGFREWDLAFYLSKNKQDLSYSYKEFDCLLSDERSKIRFLFLYILASLLHPKASSFEGVYKNRIQKAFSYLELLNK